MADVKKVEMSHPDLPDHTIWARPGQVKHYTRSGWKPVPKSKQSAEKENT